jgi:hypothetical protein
MLFPFQKKNYRDSISLDFLKPVEDMQSLTLPILVNPEEEKPLDLQHLTPQQIEELIRKNKPPNDKGSLTRIPPLRSW